MSQRHKDALGIAAGACNPLAISNAISRAMNEIREQDGGWSTTDMTNDPAIKHMVAQLAYICGVWDGINDFARDPTYRDCDKACQAEIEARAA